MAVPTVGIDLSYGGFLATRAMVDPHPALRAVSPQATCADMFIGDDFHHNGAFRLSYSFVAAAAFEAEPYIEYWDRWDTYDWFLDLGPLSNVNARHFHGVSQDDRNTRASWCSGLGRTAGGPSISGPTASWRSTSAGRRRSTSARTFTRSFEAPATDSDAVAHLFASTTGTSADWVAKLIDIYPDDHPDEALRGYQHMVAGEVFRARFGTASSGRSG